MPVTGQPERIQHFAIGQSRRKTQRLLNARILQALYRLIKHADHGLRGTFPPLLTRQRQQKEQLGVGRPFARGVQRIGQLGFQQPAHLTVATNLPVVHEQVFAMAKRVAVVPGNGSAGGRAHMGKKQT